MPKVPLPSTQQPGNPVQVSPWVANQYEEGIREATASTEQSLRYQTSVMNQIQQATDNIESMKAEVDIRRLIDNAAIAISQRSDYQQFPEDSGIISDQIRNEIFTKYGNNPRVWRSLAPYLDSHVSSLQKTIELKRIQLAGEDAAASIKNIKAIRTQDYVNESDPTKRALIRNSFYSEAKKLQMDNLLTAEQAATLTRSFDIDVERTEVIEGLRSSNPAIISQTIKRIDEKNYPTLQGHDPDWLANAKMTAESRLSSVTESIRKRLDEGAINQSISSIESNPMYALPNGRIDYAAIDRTIHSRKFQEENGLLDVNKNPDYKRIEIVQNYFKGRRSEQDSISSQEKNDYEKKLALAIAKGNYTEAQKMTINPNSPLSGDEVAKWNSGIKSAAETIKDPIKSAQAVVLANDMIIKGEKSVEEISRIISTELVNLTTSQKEHYLNKLYASYNDEIKEGRRLGYQLIRDVLIPKSSGIVIGSANMLATKDIQPVLDVELAQKKLDDWISEQIKEKARLTSNDIRTKALALTQTGLSETGTAKRSTETLADWTKRVQEERNKGK